MTNEVNYTPIKYACNGATDSFSFQWKIIAASDLIVILEDETTKEQIILNDGVDYMLYQDIVGGYIVTTNKYPQGKNIILSREVSLYQDKTYSSSSGFQAKEIEESFDKLSANVQDLKYTLDRALKVPVGSGKLNVEFPEELINDNTLVWSDEQDAFVNYDVIGEMDSFEQEIEADVDAFKSSVNQTLQQNKENTDADILSFKQNVNSEISSFKQTVNTQIETFEQEIESDIDSFKNTTNQTLQQNKQNTDADIASFKQSVNSEISTFKEEQQNAYDEFTAGVDEKIEKVADAAGKIDELEESVVVAVKAAEDATNAAEQLTGALDSFVTKEELDEAVENVDVDLTGYIKNKENISGAISIGNTTSAYDSTTVGSGARSGKYGAAFGRLTLASGEYSAAMGNGAEASGDGSTAIGSGSSAVAQATAIGKSAKATATHSIQIGQGTNSTANTLQAGNYPLLNLSTGKIPEERLPEAKGGLPVGTIIPVTASSSHVPENTLYCDGTEFSGATGKMFRNLYVDYLIGVAKVINAQIIIPTSVGFTGIFKFKTSSDITTNQQLISNDDLGYTLAYISSGKLYYTETTNGDLVELGTLTPNSTFYLKIRVVRVVDSVQTIAFGTSLENFGTAKIFASGDVGSNITITTHNTATSVYANSTIDGSALYSNDAFNSKVEAYSVTITDIEGVLEGSKLDTCSYAEYETELTMTGSCYKWAVDTANEKFKIPFIPDKVLTDVDDIIGVRGNGMTLGLTNGTSLVGLRMGAYVNYDTLNVGVEGYGASVGTDVGQTNVPDGLSLGITPDTSKSGAEAVAASAKTYKTIRHYVVVSTGSINQNEADWSEFASSLASKANIDGSNFNASVKNFDGEWVAKVLTLSTATAVGSYDLDLSNYIPNDGYQYEIKFNGVANCSGSAYSNGLVYTTPIGSLFFYNSGTNNRGECFSFSTVVGSDRLLRLVIQGAALTAWQYLDGFTAIAYRRIGTNQ